MKISDFIETYKGNAKLFGVDRTKIIQGELSEHAKVFLSPMILSCGYYKNSPMKYYTILDISFDGMAIYLDFNGDEFIAPNEPPKDVIDYLCGLDKKYEPLIGGRMGGKTASMLFKWKEEEEKQQIIKIVNEQIESNPVYRAIKEKFFDPFQMPEQFAKKEEVKLANKETRYDKDGAEMTFAFYPKDLIISSINAFADKGVTVLGSIEYFCGIPSQIHHSFGCQITTIIDQINDIPCNVLLSGHLVFLKKGK